MRSTRTASSGYYIDAVLHCLVSSHQRQQARDMTVSCVRGRGSAPGSCTLTQLREAVSSARTRRSTQY
eukprot:239953-Pleurochrysis_carterae.AAC.1